MSRFPRLIAAVAVTVLLAACGQDGASPVGPAGPSMDGGITIGGGNYAQPDTTGTPPGTEQSGTSAESGGITIGGGN